MDTLPTITNLRTDLTNLDSGISVVQYDIKKFNLYAKENKAIEEEG